MALYGGRLLSELPSGKSSSSSCLSSLDLRFFGYEAEGVSLRFLEEGGEAAGVRADADILENIT